MPAKTKKQRKFIFAKRRQYKSKSKAPKKWKWVFGKEWAHLENIITNFEDFKLF